MFTSQAGAMLLYIGLSPSLGFIVYLHTPIKEIRL